MNKKTLNKRLARKFIEASRINGINDQEIYNALNEEYFDREKIAPHHRVVYHIVMHQRRCMQQFY